MKLQLGARLTLGAAALLLINAAGAHDENPSAPPDTRSPLRLTAALSHSAYTKGAPQTLLLKIDYAASAENAAPDRPPLNIALVLDHSGSMAEMRKLPFTIEAAREVIANLTERDVVSIITFNHKVTVLSPAGPVVNKAFLFHRLDEVVAGGYTDISAGLLECIAQIDSRRGAGQLMHVLLLTDGIANRGLVTAKALGNVAAKAHARGIGISTFGCGTEFDEKRMAEIANAGGGRYIYVKEPEKIPDAFVDELHGMLQVVAQNAALEVTVVGGEINQAQGQALEKPVASHKIDIGNLRIGERGMVLMQLMPSNFENSAAIEAQVRLTFDDAEAGARVNQSAQARANFAPDADQLGENTDIVLYGQVLTALEQAEEAAKGLDRESAQQAHAAFDQLYSRAHDSAVQRNDQELLNQTFLLKHFMEELAVAEKRNLLHSHKEAHAKLTKQAHYRDYLLRHHRAETMHE